MRWDYPLLDINPVFSGWGNIFIIILLFIIVIIIIFFLLLLFPQLSIQQKIKLPLPKTCLAMFLWGYLKGKVFSTLTVLKASSYCKVSSPSHSTYSKVNFYLLSFELSFWNEQFNVHWSTFSILDKTVLTSSYSFLHKNSVWVKYLKSFVISLEQFASTYCL